MYKQQNKRNVSDEIKEGSAAADGSSSKIKSRSIETSPGVLKPIVNMGGQEGVQSKEIQARIQKLEIELENKNKMVMSLNEELSSKSNTYTKLKGMYDAVKRENEDLKLEHQNFASTSDEVIELRMRINQKNDEISAISEEKNNLTTEIEELKHNIYNITKEKTGESRTFTQELEKLRITVQELEIQKGQFENDYKTSSARVLALEQDLIHV